MLLFLQRQVWDRAWLLLVLTTILWGGNGVASKLAVGRISPMSLVFMRWFAVCLVLSVLLRHQLREHADTLRKHRRYLLAMSGLGFTVFTVCFYYAAYWTTAVNMTLLQPAIPTFVLIGAALSGRERITAMQVVGLLVTLTGVLIIATGGNPLHLLELRFNVGDLLVLGACVLYAGYTLALRDRPPLPPLVFFTALALGAFITTIPFMMAEVALGGFYWPSRAGLAIMVFVAIGPSLASQLMFMRGVELMGRHPRRPVHKPDAALRCVLRGAADRRTIPHLPCGCDRTGVHRYLAWRTAKTT